MTLVCAGQMSTVTTSTDATLQRAGSAVLRQRAEGTSVVVVGSGGVVTSSGAGLAVEMTFILGWRGGVWGGREGGRGVLVFRDVHVST